MPSISDLLRSVRWKLRRLLGGGSSPSSVMREWEWYARDFRRRATTGHLGDEWNDPLHTGVDVPAGQLVEYLAEKLIRPSLHGRQVILEIGAGGGRFTGILASCARRVIAADTSPTMLRLIGERFRDQPSIETMLLSGQGLAEVAAESVDGVFSYDVFVHLSPWESFRYLRDISRILRPGGRAVIHHSNTLSPLGRRKFLEDSERFRLGERPKGRFAVMTPDLMSSLAKEAGLFVVESNTTLVRRDCITIVEPGKRSG